MNKKLFDYYTPANFSTFFKDLRSEVGKNADDEFILWNELTENELSSLSIDYIVGRGTRIPSTFLEYLFDSHTENTLKRIVKSRFALNWLAIYNAYFITQYNPLHNYDMEETRSPDLEEKIDTDTNAKTTTNSNNGVYGFNSDEAVPQSESEITSEGTKDENFSSSTKTNKGKETTTRTGNNGVSSLQSLLTSELELRKYDYWEMVFRDLDMILCRGLY